MLAYVSVRSASRRGFFLVLHRNIAVIRVCLSAVRRTGVNEFVTPVTQTVAYIGYAPVCGGGAFAYSMRIFPRHDAVSACGRNERRTGSPSFFGVARQICVLRKYALPKNGDFFAPFVRIPEYCRARSKRACAHAKKIRRRRGFSRGVGGKRTARFRAER